MFRKQPSKSGVVLAVALCAGCGGDPGPPRVQVTGQVTYDGQPLTTGVVSFFPEDETSDARSATGHLQSDGRYVLGTFQREDGVVAGKFRVSVLSYETNLETGEDVWLIPKKFSSADASGLTAEVAAEPADQVIDFHLQRER